MNEIPDDIMEAAKGALNSAVSAAMGGDPQPSVFIAKALLAERERCAAVAIEYDGGGRKNNDVGWALSDVAAAIRQGQAKEGESA